MRCVGIIGARGYVGAELVRLVMGHPGLELAFVGSRALAGQAVEGAPSLRYEDVGPADLAARNLDAIVLALPNGASEPFVAAAGAAILVDLSADWRFDDGWVYGLTEVNRDKVRGARRVANPGCYATGAQLALGPIVTELASAPRVFGVSGYSGAGTTPSPRNDPERLRDNLMPYGLVGHLHEKEISRHLGHAVHFLPHVAPFFRGIALTIDCELRAPVTASALGERYRARYRGEPLVAVSDEAPLVRDIAQSHQVRIGGFACDGARAVVIATIDNLLKGAATQALQNLNLALGYDELTGIPV
jgi:N-acetyl-gamma-glutamyl-phosphate reductase